MNDDSLDILCKVCERTTRHDVVYDWFSLPHEYFIQVDIEDLRFRLTRCAHCGAWKTNPDFTDEELERYYSSQYTSHYCLYKKLTHQQQLTLKVRSFLTPRFASFFLRPNTALNRAGKMLLVSKLTPRMFRCFPLYFDQPRRLLDIGCGDGEFLSWFKDSELQAIGIELSDKAVEIGRSAGLDIRQGNVEEEGVKSPVEGRFDVVRLADVLEHTLEPARMLRRCRDLLVPGGELILNLPNPERALSSKIYGIHWPGLHLPFHRYHFPPAAIKAALAENGFTVKKLMTKNHLQMLYGLDYWGQRRKLPVKLYSTVTNLLFTPLDVGADLLLPGKGDSMEIHALKTGD